MTDKENRMIEDFFKQAAQQQIETMALQSG